MDRRRRNSGWNTSSLRRIRRKRKWQSRSKTLSPRLFLSGHSPRKRKSSQLTSHRPNLSPSLNELRTPGTTRSTPPSTSRTCTRLWSSIPHCKELIQALVFNAIRDCGDAKINKIDDNTSEYTSKQLPLHQQKEQKWTMLLGKEIQMPDGFGRSRVEEGFFELTNKENAEGQLKRSYLHNNPVLLQQFTAKARKGRPSPSDAAPNEQGSVSDYTKSSYQHTSIKSIPSNTLIYR
jgi:hypothetical protein